MVGLKAMLGCIGCPCGAAIVHLSVCIWFSLLLGCYGRLQTGSPTMFVACVVTRLLVVLPLQ